MNTKKLNVVKHLFVDEDTHNIIKKIAKEKGMTVKGLMSQVAKGLENGTINQIG